MIFATVYKYHVQNEMHKMKIEVQEKYENNNNNMKCLRFAYFTRFITCSYERKHNSFKWKPD